MMGKLSYSVPENLPEKDCNITMNSHQFYETSNMRDYQGLPGKPAENARPPTSNFYSATDTGATNYTEEFARKDVMKEDFGRPGTCSGQRKNNPHPLETFMVWKFPNKLPREEQIKIKEELMHEICQDKTRSTYQVDYFGQKQGDESKKSLPSKFVNTQKNVVPDYTLNTTVRVDYQKPSYKGNLSGNTTRYGCNNKGRQPAVGVVPTVIQRSPLIKPAYDTSYTDEFANQKYKNEPVTDLCKYMQNMSANEKKVIANMLEAINNKNPVERISSWDGPSWK